MEDSEKFALGFKQGVKYATQKFAREQTSDCMSEIENLLSLIKEVKSELQMLIEPHAVCVFCSTVNTPCAEIHCPLKK